MLIWVGYVHNVILFDLSKAFDTVCHDILLSKLCAIGIDGSLLNWISSVLKNRKMQVYVKGILSQDRDVLSGVTQGSPLGPLLFLICINNVADKGHFIILQIIVLSVSHLFAAKQWKELYDSSEYFII